MASKRAAQLLGIRSNASVIGRQPTRLSFNTARAFSIAPRSQNTSISQSRTVVVGGAARLQASPAQKRWHSQAPNDLKQNKLYQFDDVRLAFISHNILNLCDGVSQAIIHPFKRTANSFRFYTSSKRPQTHVSLSTSANPMNSTQTLDPPLSTSPSPHNPMRCC